MNFLLDTNAVIALMKGESGFLSRLRQYEPDAMGISAIVAHELLFGAYRSHWPEREVARVDKLGFETVAFSLEDARASGEIRAHLAAAGTPIGPYDILIAGQTLARGLTLITRNVREFQRVPGLRWENWE